MWVVDRIAECVEGHPWLGAVVWVLVVLSPGILGMAL